MESSLYCCQVRRADRHEHFRKLLPLHGIVQLTDDAVMEQPTMLLPRVQGLLSIQMRQTAQV